MSYTITRTDGTILLTLSNTKVDQLTTSLSLIGKNVDSYGQYYNDNLVGLLENFAGVSQPRSPLIGQLWYNKGDARMYVYGITGEFKPVVASQASATQPTITNQGDVWVDTTNKQLYFSTDGTNFTLAGPQYSALDGKSGWLVETITDSGLQTQIVASLYNKNTLLAIASANAFTFASAQNGMTSVQAGFNLNQSIPGIRFVGTATSTDTLLGFTPSDYLRNTGTQTLNGGLAIRGATQIYGNLILGANQTVQINEGSTSTDIVYATTDKGLRIRGISSTGGAFTALSVDSLHKRVGIFTETPAYPLDIVGDTRIQGSLYVFGTSTYVESTDLRINDKNIELAWTSTNVYSDIAAAGGGITLHGTTDHTITWLNNSTGWNFNTNTNITSTASSYLINGNAVMNATSVGSIVTTAPGLRRLGVLDILTVTNVIIQGNTVAASTTTLFGATTGTLYLTGSGTFGTVDVKGNRITSVATCTNFSPGTDATNKAYVDQEIRLVGTKGFTISIDITGFSLTPNDQIIYYLNYLLPISNPPPLDYLNLVEGTRVRALCSRTTIYVDPTTPQYVPIVTNDIQVTDIYGNTATVVRSGFEGQIPSGLPATGGTSILSKVQRSVKEFMVVNSGTSLVWRHSTDVLPEPPLTLP